MGKQASQPVPKKVQSKAENPLELVYSDVLGPFEVASLSGSKYVVTFIDEYTKYAVVKYMSNKSQVLDKFKEYVAETGTPTVDVYEQTMEESIPPRNLENSAEIPR